MNLSKTFRTNLIIQLFALAHLFLVWLCNYFQLNDAYLLTPLTIVLILILTSSYNYPPDVTFVLAVFACLSGFFLGTRGAQWLGSVLDLEGVELHMLCTFLITELLGYGIFLVVRRHRRPPIE